MKNPVPALMHAYLRTLGIRIDILRIQNACIRHPLPHSLRALSDTLDELQVENMVYSLSFEQLFEIEGPFIIAAGNDEYPFHIAERLDPTSQTISLLTASQKRLTLTSDQFRTVWNGMVLMAGKSEQTQEDHRIIYWLKQGLSFFERTAMYWLAALTAYFLVWGVIQQPAGSPAPIGSLLAKAAGIAVSLVIVARTHFNSHIAQRFCRLGHKSDCDEVFHSAGAKLLGWVSLGELSLVYFASAVFWGIFLTHNPVGVFRLFGLLTLPMIAYSLVWQIRHGRWCPLCLLIDLALAASLAIDFFTPQTVSVSIYPDVVNFCLFFGLCLLAVRQIIRLAEQGRGAERLRFKQEILLNSGEAFWHLLEQQPAETADSNAIACISNSQEADHTITVVMNPSCPKCAQAHKIISSLEGYRINLVFIVNKGDERSHHAALAMITAGMEYEWPEVDEITRNWYNRQGLPQNLAIDPRAEHALAEQIDYCRKIEIMGTPTVLIDNCPLPEIYDIQDLKILL